MEIEVRYRAPDGGSGGFRTETRVLQWPTNTPVAIDTVIEFQDSQSGTDVRGRIIGVTVVTYDGVFRSSTAVKQIVELELLEKDADPWEFHE